MRRRITGFHQDEHGDWVAGLECGHAQHRHNPPWMIREWVTTSEGREAFVGQELVCAKCKEALSEGRFTRVATDERRERT